jgi:hypothetical protein
MAYYYLAAQLPYLSYNQAAPMSSAEFRELARTSLEADDAQWLDLCALSPAPNPQGGNAAPPRPANHAPVKTDKRKDRPVTEKISREEDDGTMYRPFAEAFRKAREKK